ncbi:MAG TPA: amidohydrolase [Longimicrobiales bacterium]|nr:amidohydrolase [Longimicrobiales bacterium]
MTELLVRARQLAPQLVEVRRDLHRYPELGFQEVRTAAVAAERVAALGYRVRRGVGRTGVVAELGSGGPVVALRADMDALPIQEESEQDYRSTVAGVMHACGHDAHVSMLLGAATLLAELAQRGELPAGTVRLLFQPSEECSDAENKSGAMRMVDDGAMDGVGAVFGLHIGAHLPAGKAFLVQPGPVMAGTDTFTITVRGKSAHAARPNEGVDALVLAAHVVLAAQNVVARRISPLDQGVVSIGQIQGGTAENIVAESVTLRGTLRYFDPNVRDVLREELRRAVAVADALGGRGELDLRTGYPAVVNDPGASELARTAIGKTLGPDAFGELAPWMGGEDFAVLQQQAPGCFFWLGAALTDAREHHHPRFDIDESVLPLGAGMLAACAVNALRALSE